MSLAIVKSSVNGSSVVTTGMFVVEKIYCVVTTEMCVLTDGSVITGLLLPQQNVYRTKLSFSRYSCCDFRQGTPKLLPYLPKRPQCRILSLYNKLVRSFSQFAYGFWRSKRRQLSHARSSLWHATWAHAVHRELRRTQPSVTAGLSVGNRRRRVLFVSPSGPFAKLVCPL